MNYRISTFSALACLAALAAGCATSNDNSPIVPPPEVAAAADVEVDVDRGAIESPPWALPATGDLPPDPAVADSPSEVVVVKAAPETDASELFDGIPPRAKQKESQFQMLSHTFDTSGGSDRVSIKIDRFSGKTWRLDPASVSWLPIAEADAAAAPEAAANARYALQVQAGEASKSPTATFLRMDLITGDAWLYTQQQGAWKSLAP